MRFISQLLGGDFLHLVDGDGAVPVHGGLVGLVAKEVLNPLGAEALGFEEAGDGGAEDVRVEVRSRKLVAARMSLRMSDWRRW